MSSRKDEYEHQFWGFSAQELSTGFRTAIFENIQEVIGIILKSFKKRTPEEQWPALLSSCQTLLNENILKATEHFQIIEAYIQENFSIPPHVLLEEDSVQRQQYSDEDRENLDREIKDLKRRINRVHFMEFHLVQQLEKHKELGSIVEKVKELSLPHVEASRFNKDLQHLFSDTMGLEVEEANCHLKDDDSDESNEFSQPNHALKIFKKRRKVTVGAT